MIIGVKSLLFLHFCFLLLVTAEELMTPTRCLGFGLSGSFCAMGVYVGYFIRLVISQHNYAAMCAAVLGIICTLLLKQKQMDDYIEELTSLALHLNDSVKYP